MRKLIIHKSERVTVHSHAELTEFLGESLLSQAERGPILYGGYAITEKTKAPKERFCRGQNVFRGMGRPEGMHPPQADLRSACFIMVSPLFRTI